MRNECLLFSVDQWHQFGSAFHVGHAKLAPDSSQIEHAGPSALPQPLPAGRSC